MNRPYSSYGLFLFAGMALFARVGSQLASGQGKNSLWYVVEVGMKKGVDIVATYADYTARYQHNNGSGIVWERPNQSLDALLNTGQAVANQIGPWEKDRPTAPTNDNVRLNMLTPSGLRFGYGAFEVLAKEPMGKAIIDPATELMVSLIKLKK